MKRRIHVLDPFTNGHEAARRFIERQGWREDECEIIFSGTHQDIFHQVCEGPSYGVVPLSNTIVGEVTEVTGYLERCRNAGYVLTERDELELQVNHCLMAPRGIKKLEDVKAVMSKPEALRQCGDFLDKLKIPEVHRAEMSSTGAAAKRVSQMLPEVPFAAIAPEAAAKEYGLNILAENIQNSTQAGNWTRFALIENKCQIERCKVGIIGVNGRFGKTLDHFFKSVGCEVVGSDAGKPTGWTNEEVASYADVVIFAVPIRDTPRIIKEVSPFIRRDQLLMDVTSVKQPAISAMLETEAQVVGLHPMFRPGIPFDGQTVVACLSRLDDSRWKTWVVNVLATTRAKIKYSLPSDHDRYMMPVQVIPHSSNLISALLMVKLGLSVKESLDFTSPFYRIALAQVGRLLGQGASLYSDIIIENPETVRMLEEMIRIAEKLIRVAKEKDYASLENFFAEAKSHFGDEAIKEFEKNFAKTLALYTLYSKGSVTLEFPKEESQPGLLERILHTFSTRGVNLTGIHAMTGDVVHSITMSFASSTDSDEVRRALDEIEMWDKPKMTVRR